MMLNGYKVIVGTTVPRMTLSEKVTVTPEFRNEMNAWMLSFFGYTSTVERGKAYVMDQQRTMIVHPEDYSKLQKSLRTETESRPFGMPSWGMYL